MLKLSELKNINGAVRYIGGEAGQITKKGQVVCHALMLLPFQYEMGMSNLNLRQLYYGVNKRRDSSLERCFAVLPDYEALLKEKGIALHSLETKTPVSSFNLIFTELNSPLTYTTFLHMLMLANIPVIKSERTENFPIIIATGDAITNPKPMEKFVDIFVIGDISCVADKLIDKYVLCANEGFSKEAFLKSIAYIDGVYVPAVHGAHGKVSIVTNRTMNMENMPTYQIVPSLCGPMDSVIVPLTKGCNRGCNICQHKYLYTGIEEKTVEKALKDIKTGMEATGNTNINLMTNCYGDYSGFPEIIYKCNDIPKPKVNNISFMEVKLTKDNLWLIPYLKEQYKKTGEIPTVIVGAPTEKLRNILGINMTDDEVLTIARQVFRADFNKIKLKYVLGTPKETYEDFNNIFELASKINKIYFEEYSKLPEKYIVEINMYGFTGLPHTPMQYAKVNEHSNLDMKARYLNEKNTAQYVKLTFDNFMQNEIATILARGDENMAEAIYLATLAGSNFDYIPTLFNYDNWTIALNKAKIDTKFLLSEKDTNYVFPWDNIEVGTPNFEVAEKYKEIMKGKNDESYSD